MSENNKVHLEFFLNKHINQTLTDMGGGGASEGWAPTGHNTSYWFPGTAGVASAGEAPEGGDAAAGDGVAILKK